MAGGAKFSTSTRDGRVSGAKRITFFNEQSNNPVRGALVGLVRVSTPGLSPHKTKSPLDISIRAEGHGGSRTSGSSRLE
jgi:hypothetical protein